MYSHYFSGIFNPITTSNKAEERPHHQEPSITSGSIADSFAKILRTIEGQFSVSSLDSGDLLLTFIILLLLLEGDNLELVITLGLMLLLN